MSKKPSRITLATEKDIERVFGSGRLMIGFPVRPPSSNEPTPLPLTEEQLPAEEEQP